MTNHRIIPVTMGILEALGIDPTNVIEAEFNLRGTPHSEVMTLKLKVHSKTNMVGQKLEGYVITPLKDASIPEALKTGKTGAVE